MRPIRALRIVMTTIGVTLSIALQLEAQEARIVAGRVVVAGAGSPVAGAEIRALDADVSTTSAADGTWALGPLPAGAHAIVVQHVGFAERRLEVRTDDSVKVELTPKPVSLDALVVTASRRTQQLKDAVAATEVVDQSELRRAGSADLSAVLTERTGVSAEAGHPVGTGVMLQGLGSERVLILLDGQPMIGRLSGTFDLSRVPVSMVDRVEVVKGAQSTLYGSDAMGGVINVISRAPEGDVWRAGIDAVGGSRDRLDIGVHALGGVGALALGADAGRRSIELVPGHSGSAGTFATRWDGAVRAQWQTHPDVELTAGALVLDETQCWKSGALYNFVDNVHWGVRAGARLSRSGVIVSPTLYATEFRHLSRRSTEPRPVAGTGEEESQRLLKAEVLLAGTAGRVSIDGGVEARRDAIESDRVAGADRTLYAVEPFLQTTLSGETWSIAPGARFSYSEQWGSHFTPRVAALVRPVPRVAVRASVGQGFRAPSFKELYMEFLNTAAGAGYRVRGNAALRPERSNNVTTSVEWAGDRLYARAQLFYNRFDNFIETVELSDSSGLRLFTYGNIEDGMTRGAELELGATWRALRAELGYAHLAAEDRRTGAALLGRPEHSARTTLAYARASGFRAALTGVYTGSTPVSSGAEGVAVRDGFVRFDVRASQALPNGLEVNGGVDNIAGVQPELWPGFVRRQFHVGVAWRRGEGER